MADKFIKMEIFIKNNILISNDYINNRKIYKFHIK